MSEESNTSLSCPLLSSASTAHFIETLAYVAVYVIKPIFLLLDLVGHLLLLMTLYKQSRKSKLYKLKLYEAVSRAFLCMSTILKLLFLDMMSGVDNTAGVVGFRKNYGLMWIAAHITIPLEDGATTVVLFMSFATALDRFYAIAFPTAYKQRNKKMWEWVVVSFSIIASVLLSIFVCFLFTFYYDSATGLYTMEIDPWFQVSQLAAAMSHLRNAIWILGVVLVTVTGSALLHLYRKRNRQVSNMTATASEPTKEKTRKEAEKTLFILTMYQAFQIVNQISMMAAHSLLNLIPRFPFCEGQLYAAVRNIWLSVVTASDFYVMVLVNKPFRNSITAAMPKKSQIPVTTTVMVQSAVN